MFLYSYSLGESIHLDSQTAPHELFECSDEIGKSMGHLDTLFIPKWKTDLLRRKTIVVQSWNTKMHCTATTIKLAKEQTPKVEENTPRLPSAQTLVQTKVVPGGAFSEYVKAKRKKLQPA